MKDIRFGENLKPVMVLAPQNIVATATATAYSDLKLAQHLTYIVSLGAMTSDSTDTVTITLECSTAGSSNATEVATGFKYRLSSAIGTESYGAISSATSDGVALAADSADTKILLVDVDPAAIANVGADYRFVRLVATPNAEMGSCFIGANAFVEPRYAGNAIPSS